MIRNFLFMLYFEYMKRKYINIKLHDLNLELCLFLYIKVHNMIYINKYFNMYILFLLYSKNFILNYIKI